MTRHLILAISSAFLAAVFGACGSRMLDRGELLEYLLDESNGLIRKHTFSDIEYTLLFWPKELIIDHEKEAVPEGVEADSLLNEYRDCLFFRLELRQDSNDLLVPANPMFNYYLHTITTQLKDRVFLRENGSGRECPLSSFNMPRTFGSTYSTALLLCFKQEGLDKMQGYNVSIKDLITNAPLEFDFKATKLKRLPKLNLKTNKDGNTLSR